jgi:hypothetical protein
MLDGEERAVEVVQPSALEALTRGEIDVQIATAKGHPRSYQRFRQNATAMATLDPEIASQCRYLIKRGNKNIEGPSARLAEIVATAYTNLRVASRVVHEDKRFITCQGVCHDLESNVAVQVEVRRRITNRSGSTFSDDMIAVTANAALSIARRNAIFSVIPGALWKPVADAAAKVAAGDAASLPDRRNKARDWIRSQGVSDDSVLFALGASNWEDVGVEQLEDLQGIAVAIQGGDLSLGEAFPKPAPKKPMFSEAAK